MPRIAVQKPTDQPTGALRLINELRAGFDSRHFDDMRMIVAFARHGPLLRLTPAITRWRTQRKRIRAIFGIDQLGTSRQALQFALDHFSESFVVHAGSSAFSPTFHPKMYLFSGKERALAFIGSNNLTVGGTETNLECFIKLELSLPTEKDLWTELVACWDDTVKAGSPLDANLLASLLSSGMVLDESQMHRSAAARSPTAGTSTSGRPPFPALRVQPPSPIPMASLSARPAKTKRGAAAAPTSAAPTPSQPLSIGAQALVIQISPHRNGEVFLSKRAIDQNPAFFGWPFTGRTVPKKPTNPSYPQRTPDPVVDLKVFNAKGALAVRHSFFRLNTVYYERKHEIRITVPPDVVKAVPAATLASLMVMRQAAQADALDYDIEIHVKGSPQYDEYLRVCNQKMPSGGRTKGRKFGWL
jgi:hypothetical protein